MAKVERPLLDREHRITQLQKLVAAGRSKHEILLYARQKWKLSTRQAYRWVSACYRSLARAHQKAKPDAAIVEAQLQQIISGAMAAGQWSAARAAVVDLARLKGFFLPGAEGHQGPVEITHNTQNNLVIGEPALAALSPIEKRKLLTDLEARRTEWTRTSAPTSEPRSLPPLDPSSPPTEE